MEQEIFSLLQGVSWAGVAALLVWKIIPRILDMWEGRNGNGSSQVMRKLNSMQSNDLTHLQDAIEKNTQTAERVLKILEQGTYWKEINGKKIDELHRDLIRRSNQ